MEHTILHADCNKFYASVEALYHPELKNTPFVVGGDPQQRHGIVLTKSEEAAAFGICTGEPLWQAYQKCPQLTVISPHFECYEAVSRMVYNIYRRYTDYIEPFGLDEAWLDVTNERNLFGSGPQIAHHMKETVKKELGITISVGVSFNKIFAKLGSDYKKPDAVTVFSKENFREKVWPLPVSSLLFVGQHLSKKLQGCFLYTIGDVANTDPEYLKKLLGKQGKQLYEYANGLDTSPVVPAGFQREMKSLSNSTTPSCDLHTETEVKQYFYLLAEHLSLRMAEKNLKAKTICISLRDTNLSVLTRQIRLDHYTNLSGEIAQSAFRLFQREYPFSLPIRSLGLGVSDFGENTSQLDFFGIDARSQKLCNTEAVINQLKRRFGDTCIQHAILLEGKTTKKHSTFGHCVFQHVNDY